VSDGIWTRRGFVRSLSRTALVLSLEDVLSVALPAQQAGSSRPVYNFWTKQKVPD
jgi:hypothetical protein